MQEPEHSRRPDTTRDQRRDAQLMRRLGYTQSAISAELGLSLGQVQYALSHTETPVTRPGRPSKLSEAQVEELKAFVAASKENERMPYGKIPQALGWDVGEYCIRHALRKLGYKRPVGGGRRKSGAQSKKKAGGLAATATTTASTTTASESATVSRCASAGAASSAASAASPATTTTSSAAPETGPDPESGSGGEAEAEAEQGGGNS
ncbi:hypothetical protein J3F83DRAFT_197474 [Trichoderma novae-zelandiae]